LAPGFEIPASLAQRLDPLALRGDAGSSVWSASISS
jgi:hypothetical protein